MKKRRLKRTAGQRRFLILSKQMIAVRSHLFDLQRSMQSINGDGKQLRQMYIMQKITEAIERLNHEIL